MAEFNRATNRSLGLRVRLIAKLRGWSILLNSWGGGIRRESLDFTVLRRSARLSRYKQSPWFTYAAIKLSPGRDELHEIFQDDYAESRPRFTVPIVFSAVDVCTTTRVCPSKGAGNKKGGWIFMTLYVAECFMFQQCGMHKKSRITGGGGKSVFRGVRKSRRTVFT